jgi:hypothetical protein
VTRAGRAALPVTCRAARCTTVVRVFAASGRARSAGAATGAQALIGSGRATVAKGAGGKVTVSLTRAGRALLASKRRLRVVVEVRMGKDVVRRTADLSSR